MIDEGVKLLSRWLCAPAWKLLSADSFTSLYIYHADCGVSLSVYSRHDGGDRGGRSRGQMFFLLCRWKYTRRNWLCKLSDWKVSSRSWSESHSRLLTHSSQTRLNIKPQGKQNGCFFFFFWQLDLRNWYGIELNERFEFSSVFDYCLYHRRCWLIF